MYHLRKTMLLLSTCIFKMCHTLHTEKSHLKLFSFFYVEIPGPNDSSSQSWNVTSSSKASGFILHFYWSHHETQTTQLSVKADFLVSYVLLLTLSYLGLFFEKLPLPYGVIQLGVSIAYFLLHDKHLKSLSYTLFRTVPLCQRTHSLYAGGHRCMPLPVAAEQACPGAWLLFRMEGIQWLLPHRY